MNSVFDVPQKMENLCGQEIKITPIQMQNLQRFSAAIMPIANDLLAAFEGSGDLFLTCSLHGDRMVEAVVAAGVPRDLAQRARPDEFMRVAASVIEVNADFFVNRLLPQLKVTVAELNKSIAMIKQRNGTE